MKRTLIINLFMALFIGTAISMVTGFSPVLAAAVVYGAGQALPYLGDGVEKGLTFMAIQTQVWHDHIEEEIFKDNSFLKHAVRVDNENILNNSVVHIPQSGGSGNVVKNRKSLPANVRKRNDTDIVYLIDEYTTDPVLIPNIDTKELSYDKRNSVLGEDRDKLTQTVAEWTIYNWLNSGAVTGYAGSALPAASIVDTTGSAITATAPGATGNRKAASRNDLQTMRTRFNKENRWFEGKMYCLLTPEMEAQMFPSNDIVTATYSQNLTEAERREGVVYKCHGWKIMVRSSVIIVNGTTIQAPGEVANTDDDEGSLFWYEGAVELAMGQTEAFENMGDPTFYGDVYSFLVRSGSRARRSDYLGIKVLRGVSTT